MGTMARPAVALALALSLSVAPVFSAAPELAQVRGRIFTADLASPAAGLDVQAIPDGAKTPVAATATDDRGSFRFAELLPGEYTLVFTNDAGSPVAASKVNAVAGEKQALTLALPSPLAPGETTPAPGEEGKKRRGLLGWISTPLGAVVAAVVVAVGVGIAVDQATDDDEDEPDVTPVQPS